MHKSIAIVLVITCFLVDEIVENLMSFESGMLKISVAPTVVAINSGDTCPPTVKEAKKEKYMLKNLLALFLDFF